MKNLLLACLFSFGLFNSYSADTASVRITSVTYQNNILNIRWDAAQFVGVPDRFIICISYFHSQSDCINAPANEKFYTVQLDPNKSLWRTRGQWGYNFIEEFYPHDKEFMDQFRNKKVRIIVWGCSTNGGCKKSNTKFFDVPYAKGSFEAEFEPVLKSQTCLNCHDMRERGGKWNTHIRAGRFSRNTDTSNPNVCIRCHTASRGYVDGWRAPNAGSQAYLIDNNLSTTSLCNQIRRAGASSLGHHLLHDPLILWGLNKERINMNTWRRLVGRYAPRGANEVKCSTEGKVDARINRNYRTGTKLCYSHHNTASCTNYPIR